MHCDVYSFIGWIGGYASKLAPLSTPDASALAGDTAAFLTREAALVALATSDKGETVMVSLVGIALVIGLLCMAVVVSGLSLDSDGE